MAKREPKFKPTTGAVLVDRENPERIVRLVYRFDPQGKDVHPYWVVKNLQSGEETSVLESEISKRYHVPVVPTAPKGAEQTADAPGFDAANNRKVPEVVTAPSEPDEETIYATDEPTA